MAFCPYLSALANTKHANMKVRYSSVSQPSFGLNLRKNNSNVEHSPTGSDYSLPCLSSDDAPHVGYAVDEAATFIDTGILVSIRNHTDRGETLPPSDIPSPASPITAASSQEDTYAIRPFPLLHLMQSPGFAAIRDMNDAPSKCIDGQ